METLDTGSEMLMSGPYGQLAYQGFGKFLIKQKVV